MQSNNCPLCGSANVFELENLKVKDLFYLYKKIGIDVGYLFESHEISYCHCQNCDLKFFDPCVTGDERFYNDLQKKNWYYLDEKPEYNYALQYIKSTDRVLEIGCGKGAFSKLLPTNDYKGLEFSREAVKMAKNEDVTILHESIQDHSLTYPEFYDLVCSFQVIEHVSDIHNFIGSAVKTIKKGGKLIIAVPSDDSFLRYVTNYPLNLPPHHVSRWSDKCLNSFSNIFDLELVKIHHENLQQSHQKLFFKTFILKSMINTKKLIDCSLKYKFMSKLVSIMIRSTFRHGINKHLLPNGHTVVAVYRRK